MSDAIPRLNAALQGRYQVQRQLGEGGMATVYLAEDLRHHRNVALKVLRPELAAVVGAQRFLAEIETTARLQHPHILALHDSGDADGLLFYVMPHVEGESLRARLDREHQLPIDEAVRIATNVAEALDYAHRHGVIHRDIKPANILLFDGKPTISDFGIALAVSSGGAGRLTETGLSLGTPHYMSPEQATGDGSVGPATDIWALGCVLYEMLVGEPPYTGGTPQAVLGKIITAEAASAAEVRRSVPPNVDAAIRKALEKVPADRFRSAEDFARALAEPTFRHGHKQLQQASAVSGAVDWDTLRRDWRFVAVSVAALAAATAALALAVSRLPRDAVETSVTTRTDWTPEGGFSGTTAQLAICRDGTRIAWNTGVRQDQSRLYVRRADALTGTLVPGSVGARSPVFSPDCERLAFIAGGDLMSAAVSGGPPITVASPGFFPTDWGQDGTIIGWSVDGTLFRVSSTGGAREVMLEPDGTRLGRFPRMLPGGEALLYTASAPEGSEIRHFDLRSREQRTLIATGSDARYLPTGHIVYGHPAQALLGSTFDPDRLELGGEPRTLVEPVMVLPSGSTQFEVSWTGTALYVSSTDDLDVQAVLVDARGVEEPLAIPSGPMSSPRISPDGRWLSYVDGPVLGNVFAYSFDLRNRIQLTFEGINQWPLWSLDSALISFASERAGSQSRDVFRVAVDMPGTEVPLFSLPSAQHPQAWGSDGQLLFRHNTLESYDLHVASFTGESVAVAEYLSGPWDELAASISPDGRWAAYVSEEDGTDEVYVRAFPRPAGSVKISSDGGATPLWSRDGSALHYRTLAGDFVRVRIQTDPEFAVLSPEPMFTGSQYYHIRTFAQYDVHPDGERFVVLRTTGEGATTGSTPVIVVTNWFDELRRSVGIGER